MSDRRPVTAMRALELLVELGAPARLVRHAELVGEAASALLSAFAVLGVDVDRDLVSAGAILHDVGKVLHGDELSAPGGRHEDAGERLLLERGVAPDLARICRSHSQWATMDPSFEELVVALSDKLWKGVRHPALEARVISEAATRRGPGEWEVFIALDDVFERIAAGGDERLARSVA